MKDNQQGGAMVPAFPKSVLVIKPSSFGDVVHTLPAVARFKAVWPQAHLAWVLNYEWSPLLEGNGFVDETVLFPRADFRGIAGPFKFMRWSRTHLASRKPDLVVDFQGLLRSGWMGRASRGKWLVGLADAREGARWFYDQEAKIPAGVPHAVERYDAMANAVLRHYEADKVVAERPSDASLLPPGKALSDKKVELTADFVLVHPFARGKGKSLSVDQLARLCLSMFPRQVVVVGRQGDTGIPMLPSHCVNLLDQTTLSELIWLIRRAAVVVTVDSGPSHLAALLGRPMVAIHTWSDPRRVGPYRSDAWVCKNRRLVQMADLCTLGNAFFRPQVGGLSDADVEAVAVLATSL